LKTKQVRPQRLHWFYCLVVPGPGWLYGYWYKDDDDYYYSYYYTIITLYLVIWLWKI